jgi:hypothetical protein
MATIQIHLQQPYKRQQEFIDNKKRNNFLLLPRRFGKTTLTKILIAVGAIQNPGYRAAWASPTWKLMLEVFEEFVETLKPLTKRLNREDRRITLYNGSVLEFWSSNDPSAGRGRKYNIFVCDEMQRQRKLMDFVKGSVRPCLADLQGDLWILGTPNGEGTEFHDLYLEAKANDDIWYVANGTLNDNPYMHPEEIEMMRRDLGPLMSAQEIDAQWIPVNGLSPLVSHFDWLDLIKIPDGVRPQKVMALDASISGDTTALLASWRDQLTQLYYVDYDDIHTFTPSLEDVETGILQIDFAEVETVIWRMWQTGRYAALVYDPYQAVSLAQRLRRRGVRTIEFTQNTMRVKADSYLRQVINDGALYHPNHDELNNHIKNATVKYTPNGGLRIIKPEKKKKIDLAVALSMSIYAQNTLKPGIVSKFEPEVIKYQSNQSYQSQAVSTPFSNLQALSPFNKRR